MDFAPTPRALDYAGRIRAFIAERILPVEEELFDSANPRHYGQRGGDWTLWTEAPEIAALTSEARAAGLWNLFLPEPEYGAGLSTVEYATLAEEMGKSVLAPEIFNCNAPDTGNMEVLAKYGSSKQKAEWLEPLLAGEIRSVFCMTEPEVASSDATNLLATIEERGDSLILNGRKWWTTGLGHPRCRLALFLGRSNPEAPRHQQHSLVLVPLDTPGVTIRRMLPVFGEYDPPYGHGEVDFVDVRVPRENLVLGLGRGFEIAQGRLGPGRIHHCMRCLGAAERALELMIRRGLARVAFGKPLIDLGGNRERVADFRIAIDQARLLTLHAAWRIDQVGALAALPEISAIKVVAPNVLQSVVDAAIQIYGGAGLSHDTPLASLYAIARALRLADGPDEVHRALIAKAEIAKYKERGAP
ncbi:MAG TPA: acyl-CoA dehydrogenase family protein [Thermoanaerobaculia bacterium]|nr:acyl-CoA dehydrogenase family protein [Thermoanaerobaculia bacterium]